MCSLKIKDIEFHVSSEEYLKRNKYFILRIIITEIRKDSNQNGQQLKMITSMLDQWVKNGLQLMDISKTTILSILK